MKDDKLHIITTVEKLKQAIDYIKNNLNSVNNIAAFDTETTGPIPIVDTIIGWSISLFEDEGIYFPHFTWTDEQKLCTEAPGYIPGEGENIDEKLYQCVSNEFIELSKEFISYLKVAKLLMHNATFDVIVTRRNFDIDLVKSVYCDTMLLKHTLDCERPHGLKECAVKYFGEDSKDEQTELGGSVIRNGGKWTGRDKWIWRGDLYYVGKYAAMDTALTLRLFNYLEPKLEDLNLTKFFYEDEVMPLLRYGTIPMKDVGFKIDVGHFKRAKLRIQSEIENLESQLLKEVTDVTGPLEQVHLDSKYPPSPKRAFGECLILEVGLPLPVNSKTGKFSTAKGVIDKWSKEVIKKATEDQIKVIWYIQEEADKVPEWLINKVQRRLWEEKQDKPIINLGSAKQFEYIVGKKWGVKSTETTAGGAQKFDAGVIQKIAIERMINSEGLNESEAEDKFNEYMECDELPTEADWFIKYLRKKKLEKLVSAFIDGILEKAIDGRIHTDMLQHGTSSGRYSSRNPNCLSMDTEILTDRGWKSYSNWDMGAKIAAVKEGKVEWEVPEDLYISPENEKHTVITLKNTHMNIRATDNHRMLVQHRKTKELKEFTFDRLYNRVSREYNILHGAILEGKGIKLSDDEIRLLVAIQADATVYNHGFVRFSFSKTRKADRLKDLLSRLEINYEFKYKETDAYKSGYRYEFYLRDSHYYVNGLPHYLKNKSFNWGLLEMNSHQREVFLNELDYWDGLYTRRRTNYNSCSEKDVDVVQALCALNNERAHKRIYDYNLNRKEGSRSYQLDMTQRNYSGLSNVAKSREESIERVWCVKVPSGKFIARRGGDTFVVYNCQQLPSHSALGMVIKKGFIA